MFRFKFLRLKIFLILLSSIFLAFFVWLIWQFYLQMKFQFETEVVYSETITKKIDVFGVIFKDEKILNYGNDNFIIKNIFNDGERVAKYAEVARKYSSEADIKKLDDLKKLDEKIFNLGNLKKSNLSNKSFGNLNKQLHNNYFEILNCLKNSDSKLISKIKNKMVNIFNQKQILAGKVKDFNSSIENLKKERASIKKLISSNYKSIFTPYSGYFVGSVDGFEQQCSLEKLSEFDSEKLKRIYNLMEKKIKNKKYGGKVILNPSIFFKVILPKSFYIDFKVGSQCMIKFEQTGEEVLAELVDFNFGLNKTESLATFEIDSMTSQLAPLRNSRAEVGFNKYYGLKLNKSAIRKNEKNQAGVYVLIGSSIKFKLIDILVEDRDYVISKIHDDTAYLRELDEVVIKGKDLYNSKKIKKNL